MWSSYLRCLLLEGWCFSTGYQALLSLHITCLYPTEGIYKKVLLNVGGGGVGET